MATPERTDRPAHARRQSGLDAVVPRRSRRTRRDARSGRLVRSRANLADALARDGVRVRRTGRWPGRRVLRYRPRGQRRRGVVSRAGSDHGRAVRGGGVGAVAPGRQSRGRNRWHRRRRRHVRRAAPRPAHHRGRRSQGESLVATLVDFDALGPASSRPAARRCGYCSPCARRSSPSCWPTPTRRSGVVSPVDVAAIDPGLVGLAALAAALFVEHLVGVSFSRHG